MAIGQSPFEGQSPFSITDIDPNDLLRAYGDLSPALFHGMITQGRSPIEIAWDVVTKKKGQQTQIGTTFQAFNNRFGNGQGLGEDEKDQYAQVMMNEDIDGGDVARGMIANTSQEVGKIQSAFNREEKVRNFAAAANEIYPQLSLIPLDKFIEMYPSEAERLRISLEEAGLAFNDIKGYLETNLNEASIQLDREATSEQFNNVFNVNDRSRDAHIAETVSGGDPPQQIGPELPKDLTEKFLGEDIVPTDESVSEEVGLTPQELQRFILGIELNPDDDDDKVEIAKRTLFTQTEGLLPISTMSPSYQFNIVAASRMGSQKSRPGVSDRAKSFQDVSYGGFILSNVMEQDYEDLTSPREYYYQYVDRGFTQPYNEFHSDEEKEKWDKNYAKLIEIGKNMDNPSAFSWSDWIVANNDPMIFAAIKAKANITGRGVRGKFEEEVFNNLQQRYQEERAFGKTNLGPAAWFSEVGGPRFTIPKPGSVLEQIPVKMSQQGPVESFPQGAVAAGGPMLSAEIP
tara:strand:- start:612 stop:2156 length:1545 start_codon:yes stop_codon:yes gene_type:complete